MTHFSTCAERELVKAMIRYIETWNERCHPFTWAKTAETSCPTPFTETQAQDTKCSNT